MAYVCEAVMQKSFIGSTLLPALDTLSAPTQPSAPPPSFPSDASKTSVAHRVLKGMYREEEEEKGEEEEEEERRGCRRERKDTQEGGGGRQNDSRGKKKNEGERQKIKSNVGGGGRDGGEDV